MHIPRVIGRVRAVTPLVVAAIAGMALMGLMSTVVADVPSAGGRSSHSVLAEGVEYEPHILSNSGQAYFRALELAPSGIDVTDSEIKLKTRFNAATWSMGGATPSTGAIGTGNKPAWIVGLLADDLTDCDVADLGLPCNSIDVPGLFYVLDATNAKALVAGDLDAGRWNSLQLMGSDTVAINFETPVTIHGTPVPTPTWGAPQVMTPTP